MFLASNNEVGITRVLNYLNEQRCLYGLRQKTTTGVRSEANQVLRYSVIMDKKLVETFC